MFSPKAYLKCLNSTKKAVSCVLPYSSFLLSAPCAAQVPDYTNSLGRVADAINDASRNASIDSRNASLDRTIERLRDRSDARLDAEAQYNARYQAQVMAMNIQQLQNALIQAQSQNQKLVNANTVLVNKNKDLQKDNGRLRTKDKKAGGTGEAKPDTAQETDKDRLWVWFEMARSKQTKEALHAFLSLALPDGMEADIVLKL